MCFKNQESGRKKLKAKGAVKTRMNKAHVKIAMEKRALLGLRDSEK